MFAVANQANALMLGCSATEPTQLPASVVHVTDTAALNDVTTCRSECFRRRLNIAIFSSSKVLLIIINIIIVIVVVFVFFCHFIR